MCTSLAILSSGCDRAPRWLGGTTLAPSALREEIASAPDGATLGRFYEKRGYRPFWLSDGGIRPEARQLIGMVKVLPRGVLHGTDGPALDRLEKAAASGDSRSEAQLEVTLSSALLELGQALHEPVSQKTTYYVGPSPSRAWPDGVHLLTDAAEARSLHNWLSGFGRVNPLQLAYIRGLRSYQATWSHLRPDRINPGPVLRTGDTGPRVVQLARRLGVVTDGQARFDDRLEKAVRTFQHAHGLPPTGAADGVTVDALNRGPAYYEQVIRANLDRAGALPLDLGSRYVLVNSAAQELYAVDNGRVRDRMRVIIGKADTPTPDMVAALSFMVVNPYWNVPPDLAAKRAARVVQEGFGVIEEERLQLLSGWEGDVRELKPDEVDWRAVASGRTELRVRQRPGGDNMMGKVKFMAPNRLGIYLHDTPIKSAFALPDRRLSAGCVRVEDAPRLARWLMRRPSPLAVTAPNQRVDLPKPVPVYIGYFTAVPDRGRIAFRNDIYRRDPALLARLDRGRAFVASAAGASKRPVERHSGRSAVSR